MRPYLPVLLFVIAMILPLGFFLFFEEAATPGPRILGFLRVRDEVPVPVAVVGGLIIPLVLAVEAIYLSNKPRK